MVTWDQVYKEKREGGLGVLNLKSFNLALIAKLWWGSYRDLGGSYRHCYGENMVYEGVPGVVKIEMPTIFRVFERY